MKLDELYVDINTFLEQVISVERLTPLTRQLMLDYQKKTTCPITKSGVAIPAEAYANWRVLRYDMIYPYMEYLLNRLNVFYVGGEYTSDVRQAVDSAMHIDYDISTRSAIWSYMIDEYTYSRFLETRIEPFIKNAIPTTDLNGIVCAFVNEARTDAYRVAANSQTLVVSMRDKPKPPLKFFKKKQAFEFPPEPRQIVTVNNTPMGNWDPTSTVHRQNEFPDSPPLWAGARMEENTEYFGGSTEVFYLYNSWR